jgi:ribonuclease P/MRP protein subunit POP5
VKHLPKHLRARWRYLAVSIETWPDASLDRGTVQRHVWYAARDLLGDVGSAALDLTVVSAGVRDGTGRLIVRTYRGEVDRARAVLATLSRIDGHEVGVRVRGVSGTVRACEEKYMGGRREKTDQRDVVFRDAELSAWVRGGRVDLRTDGAFAGATTLDL